MNPGPPWYQADKLPIELSWLGSLILVEVRSIQHQEQESHRDHFTSKLRIHSKTVVAEEDQLSARLAHPDHLFDKLICLENTLAQNN